MKKTLKSLAAALFITSALTATMTACQEKIAEPQTSSADEAWDVYTIVLSGSTATRASASMEVGLREDNNHNNFTATLLKNNSPVDNSGITWSWEKSGGDYFTVSPEDEYPYVCDITGTSAASGEGVRATAVYNGHTIVSELASVTVIDDGLKEIALDVVDEMYAGSTAHYTVTVYYNDGTSENVTSEADITIDRGTTKLELRDDGGCALTAWKDANSCLGDATVTAAYGDKTDSKTVKVITDFKSTDLTCNINNGTEAGGGVSGNGDSDMSLSVPKNNGGYATLTLTGHLKTYGDISYNIYNCSYIKVWYINKYLTNGTSTDYMMPGDNVEVRIEYLGETVKSWMIHY